MMFRLQEAYKTPTGEMTTPHWDEWADVNNHNLVCDEEVEDGIKCVGKWYEVAEPDGISEGDYVWCISGQFVIEVGAVQQYGKKIIGKKHNTNEYVEVMPDDCESMFLYRRIAATSESHPITVNHV